MAEELYDVVIIGAGPAGLQAAINGVRKKATVLVLGRPERSSLYRAHVENYLSISWAGGIYSPTVTSLQGNPLCARYW